MTTCFTPYCGFRFPAEVIEHAVWLYHCFSLNLREVETIVDACCDASVWLTKQPERITSIGTRE